MSIHYKFKSSLDYDTVTFDGLHISVKDLKRQIFHQKKIGKSTDFDLQITNAQTKEVYSNDDELISKNTSLIVARVPIAAQPRKQWDRDSHSSGLKSGENSDGCLLGKAVDISALDLSEEDKIKTMMSQSTSEYDPSNYIKVRGANQVGPVPLNYVCNKCHQRGHWIKDCKNIPITDGMGIGESIRKSSGIPRSFMVPVEGPQVPGARITPTGEFVVPAIDHEVYKERKVEKPPFLAEQDKTVETTPIPDDLQCVICKDLMTDAVMAPCCGNSFCDECIRGILVESDDAECPECNEKDVSPDTLIPNRFLRNAVNNFKNKTGYTKRSSSSIKGQSPPRPSLPDFVPPGEEEPGTEKHSGEKPTFSSSSVDSNSFLYDVAVENGIQKDASALSGSPSPRSPNKDNIKNDKSFRVTKGDNTGNSTSNKHSILAPHEVSESGISPQEGVYMIPSLVPVHPPEPFPPFITPRSHPTFMHSGERAGTPTVDERYEPYGRPVALDPGPAFPPIYNPHYPPPLVQPQYGAGAGAGASAGTGYRDRGRGYRGRYPARHAQPTLPADEEEAYRAFQRMLQEKEERERRKQSRPTRTASRSRSRSRSRSSAPSRSQSPSIKRRHSYSPNRSRSHSRTPRRSRSASRASRERSFVMSRSRSRSFSKSPIERKLSPPRSPYRYERSREADYGRRERSGGYRPAGRTQHHVSPNRHHTTFRRYRTPPPRSYHSPDRYVEPHPRLYSSRWHDGRNRGRSRSISATRGYYDEQLVRPSEGRERSVSRGRRERTPSDRYREERSRERNGRRYSRGKSRDQDREERRRDVSPNRKRSRSGSSRRSPLHHNRSHRRRSMTPAKTRKRSRSIGNKNDNHIYSTSPDKQRKRSISPTARKLQQDVTKDVQHEQVGSVKLETLISLPESRLEEEPRARNPSPTALSEKQKNGNKKEKKKDKEKKKKKKEKEGEEDKELKKKKKKEKKEKKKRELLSKVEELDTATGNGVHSSNVDVNLMTSLEVKTTGSDAEERGIASQDRGESTGSTLNDGIDHETFSQTEDPAHPEHYEHVDEGEEEAYLDLNASYENLGEPEMLAPMPEPSRWERDDTGLTASMRPKSPDAPRATGVTSEVLKRAENAIFKKAISALRPESTKKSGEKFENSRKGKSPGDGENEKGRMESPEMEKKKIREDGSERWEDKELLEEDRAAGTFSRQKTIEDLNRRAISKDMNADETKSSQVVKEVDWVYREVPLKGKTESRKPTNSIQITIPVSTEREEREIGFAVEKKPALESPPPRVSVKDRLGGKVDGSINNQSSQSLALSRSGNYNSVDAPCKRGALESMYDDESSDEIERHSKMRKSANVRGKSSSTEIKKRIRSSSENSEDSFKKQKKKRLKHKKDKRSKKKSRKDASETSHTSDSSDSEPHRKKLKKLKKKKKSRH